MASPWLANCQLAIKPAPLRHMLHQERGRAAEFAAGRKSLHQPRDQHRYRCDDANGRIGRHEGDHQRAQRHQQDRDHQRRLAAVAVGIHAEDHAAQRPGQERQRKCARASAAAKSWDRCWGKMPSRYRPRNIRRPRYRTIRARCRSRSRSRALAIGLFWRLRRECRRRAAGADNVILDVSRCAAPLAAAASSRPDPRTVRPSGFSASSVTESRMCSSGACCEQPG